MKEKKGGNIQWYVMKEGGERSGMEKVDPG